MRALTYQTHLKSISTQATIANQEARTDGLYKSFQKYWRRDGGSRYFTSAGVDVAGPMPTISITQSASLAPS
jgi:hypothetical protein